MTVPGPAERLAARKELAELSTRLVADFADRVPAGAVIRCVTRCVEELRRGGVRDGLAPAAEAMARTRLADRAPAHSGPTLADRSSG